LGIYAVVQLLDIEKFGKKETHVGAFNAAVFAVGLELGILKIDFIHGIRHISLNQQIGTIGRTDEIKPPTVIIPVEAGNIFKIHFVVKRKSHEIELAAVGSVKCHFSQNVGVVKRQ
jgi:hypothetical protein